MKNYLRTEGIHSQGQGAAISHITGEVCNVPLKPQFRKGGWFGWNIQGKTCHLRSQFQEPGGQPRTLETGMPGDEYPLVAVLLCEHGSTSVKVYQKGDSQERLPMKEITLNQA
jgi:hypothetical protein